MKISFLIHALSSGGAERTVVNLATEFKKMGHIVDIVVYSSDVFYDTGDINLTNINDDKKTRSRIVGIFTKIINYKKIISKSKPDVVVCLLYPSIFYTLFIPRKIIVIGSERSQPKYEKNWIKKIIRYFLFLSVDGLIFQTDRAKSYYGKKISKKSIVIPNSVGNYYIDYVNEMNRKKVNKIVAVGSLKIEKDYPTLLKAFKNVVGFFPSIVLEIYGDGPLKASIEQEICNLGLSEKVFLMGRHKDVIVKISNARCYILSSISEGMPNSLMEAMAIGLPCVSTDCDNGPRELITHGLNGFLVPVGDYNTMASYIVKILSSNELAHNLSMNAKNINITNGNSSIANRFIHYIEQIKGA